MTTRLAAVPDAPPRALGIVRVSKEREEMISPEIQWTAITEHCERRGYILAGRIEAIDESGSQRRSPWWRRLDDAVTQVENADYDVIVVWKFSRTARNRLRWAIAIDRVEVAGGRIESATEPLDVTTSTGRLARGMLAEINAWEAERTGDVWKEVHARRTRNGMPANGKPRFGYTVQNGIHRPDPDTGHVLASMYRRYVAGESIYSLVSWLNTNGYRTVPGYSKNGPGPWTQMTLRRCLDTGFGAGFITVHGERQRGIHEPVIDEQTWTAYLGARAARRTSRRAERSTYLLSGLVRCHHPLPNGTPCGSPMGGGLFGHQRQPKFRCIASAAERRHDGGYATMPHVERQVRAWVAALASEVEQDAATKLLNQAHATRRAHDAKALSREVARIERALAKLAADHARELHSDAVYIAARDELLAEQRHAQDLAAVAAAESSRGEPAKLAAELIDRWDVYGVEQRRGILRQLIRRVEITPGRPVGAVRVVPSWLGE